MNDQLTIEPEAFYFEDDKSIPNSRLPLLLYRQAFAPSIHDLASSLEKIFQKNNWSGFWRNGVYPFHHYHSTSHEVLGIYDGHAVLQLGGEPGRTLDLAAGNVIVIPAGVGHKRISASANFGVVGAYPDGRDCDLLRGAPGERPGADRNIAAVPLPGHDPLHGVNGPLQRLWKAAAQ